MVPRSPQSTSGGRLSVLLAHTAAGGGGQPRIVYRVVADPSEIDLAQIDRSESRTGHYEYVGGDIRGGRITLLEEVCFTPRPPLSVVGPNCASGPSFFVC